MRQKYPCPCCDFLTLDHQPPGTFEICPVCGWEDDQVQYNDPNYKGGANELSLLEARRDFQVSRAADVDKSKWLRRPPSDELSK
ncbi:MAG: hypothetical protein KF757_03910 [Phycisphaeraceae bacterium]|nr:hypothetical protein [Phycisphaeraceae bacterium]MCW5763146.1 hypothetical protein [Phycisphaeraceae bacterium]